MNNCQVFLTLLLIYGTWDSPIVYFLKVKVVSFLMWRSGANGKALLFCVFVGSIAAVFCPWMEALFWRKLRQIRLQKAQAFGPCGIKRGGGGKYGEKLWALTTRGSVQHVIKVTLKYNHKYLSWGIFEAFCCPFPDSRKTSLEMTPLLSKAD